MKAADNRGNLSAAANGFAAYISRMRGFYTCGRNTEDSHGRGDRHVPQEFLSSQRLGSSESAKANASTRRRPGSGGGRWRHTRAAVPQTRRAGCLAVR